MMMRLAAQLFIFSYSLMCATSLCLCLSVSVFLPLCARNTTRPHPPCIPHQSLDDTTMHLTLILDPPPVSRPSSSLRLPLHPASTSYVLLPICSLIYPIISRQHTTPPRLSSFRLLRKTLQADSPPPRRQETCRLAFPRHFFTSVCFWPTTHYPSPILIIWIGICPLYYLIKPPLRCFFYRTVSAALCLFLDLPFSSLCIPTCTYAHYWRNLRRALALFRVTLCSCSLDGRPG